MPVGLVELTPKQKRRRVERIIRYTNPEFSREEVLMQLRRIRQTSLKNIDTFYRTFQRSARKYYGNNVVFSADATEAVSYINSVTNGAKEILTNKSATVNELRTELIQAGYIVTNTYLSQFSRATEIENKIKYYWQLLSLPEESIWESFQRTANAVPVNNNRPKDFVALLGVNAAGAKDGSIFLLQHSSNISSILQQAKKIIFVLGIEKIVADESSALFQTKCAGFFGMESILLDMQLGENIAAGRDILESIMEAEDPNREIHIVVLDNGRGSLVGEPFEELLNCISCKSCLKRCPTYRFFGRDLGRHPKDYLWSFLMGNNSSLELCLFCQSCLAECPLEINIPMMISRAKSTYSTGLVSLKDRMVTNAPSLARLGAPLAPLANVVVKNKFSRLALDLLGGIDRRRQLPGIRSASLEDWSRSRRPTGTGAKKIAYYAGCFASYFDTGIGEAAVHVLEKNGFEVTVVKNRCCGVPKLGIGDIKGATKNAEDLLKQIIPLIEQGCDILVSCPSCGLALKKEYLWLLCSEEAKLVSERTYDFSQYLTGLDLKGSLIKDFTSQSLKVVYHNPCHLKAQGIESEPVQLMSLVPGLSVEVLDRGCCGMAGNFGLKSRYYGLSAEISDPLFERLNEMAPQLIVTECAGCKMQLESGTSQDVVHPLTIIQKAYLQ